MCHTEKQVRASLKTLLEKCEATKKFSFNSRRFFSVGEWLLAFEGIFMFAKGNSEFQQSLAPEFDFLVKHFSKELDESRLPAQHWTANVAEDGQ
ncbi:hypothetical protein [Ascidiaceihabitans sp.]|uniref:hypothetical protein n=1 Tax=Ascidiaceihabitans sp. TaxID=1872644 RepID=UPI00329A3450